MVDDSPLCRQLIFDALQKDPDLEVVGTAENGREAIEKARAAQARPSSPWTSTCR